jgi:hypothetical protein
MKRIGLSDTAFPPARTALGKRERPGVPAGRNCDVRFVFARRIKGLLS